MSIDIRIQAKPLAILESEASFYQVNATAIARAIIDKVVTGGMTREVLQGVDVASYQDRRRGRSHGKDVYHFHGVDRTLKEIQAITGVNANLISSRLARGWLLERAATTPPKNKRVKPVEVSE